MKNCSACKTERPLTEFPVYNGKPWYWCKPCQRAKSKSYRQRFPDKIRKQNAAYRKENPGYSTESSRKWRLENRERHLATMRARDAKYRKEDPTWDFKRAIRQKYGLTIEQYESMYRSQNGACAICLKQHLTGKRNRLFVDHDHATGIVRGLLCGNCNSAIGHLKDDRAAIFRAITYLTRAGEKSQSGHI